jgi:DNA-binding MarR family transcriptional regulator
MQRPAFRRHVFAGLDVPGGAATIRVLRVVEADASRPPSIGDVAERLSIEPSTASRTTDAAVQAGFLSRRPGKRDQRQVRLELTAAGRGLLDEVTARRRRVLADATLGWSPRDVDRLNELLERLCDGLRRSEAAP